MRHAPDNLIKEEPSAGGVGEGLCRIEASSSIGSNGAEEAFFDGDADGATDRHLAAVEEGLEGVLGVYGSVDLFFEVGCLKH